MTAALECARRLGRCSRGGVVAAAGVLGGAAGALPDRAPAHASSRLLGTFVWSREASARLDARPEPVSEPPPLPARVAAADPRRVHRFEPSDEPGATDASRRPPWRFARGDARKRLPSPPAPPSLLSVAPTPSIRPRRTVVVPGDTSRSSPLRSSPPGGRDPALASSPSTPRTSPGMSPGTPPAETRRPRSTRPKLSSSPRRCRRRRKAGSAAKVLRNFERKPLDSPAKPPISRRPRTHSETDGRAASAHRLDPWRRRPRGPGATPRTSREERCSSEKNSTEDSEDESRRRYL
jgi:hypothetical protein